MPESRCYTWHRFAFTESWSLWLVTPFLFFSNTFVLTASFFQFHCLCLVWTRYFLKTNKHELLSAAFSLNVFRKSSKQLGTDNCCFTWRMINNPVPTVACPSHDFVRTARIFGPSGLFIAQQENWQACVKRWLECVYIYVSLFLSAS